MDPFLWFVTPVYRRFYLTKVCLEQRKRMIERLPFPAQCVVIGDDENLDVARELGFPTVEVDNDYVARKFNAGYNYALENGATHCMPIGSDSWLHESVFADEPITPKRALGIVGLSSFSPDGLERVDMAIKYPAGFGVGMVYPAHALAAPGLRGAPAEPKKNRGIDNSTWARVGKGKVQIHFMAPKNHCYINFHSTEDSITDFRLLKSSSRRVRVHDDEDPFGVLAALYDADLIEDVMRMYALRSLGVFATGVTPEFQNRFGQRRRYPTLERRGTTKAFEGGRQSRYPNVGARSRPSGLVQGTPRDYAQIEERKLRKARGLPLSRDEEMSIRFDEARGY